MARREDQPQVRRRLAGAQERIDDHLVLARMGRCRKEGGIAGGVRIGRGRRRGVDELQLQGRHQRLGPQPQRDQPRLAARVLRRQRVDPPQHRPDQPPRPPPARGRSRGHPRAHHDLRDPPRARSGGAVGPDLVFHRNDHRRGEAVQEPLDRARQVEGRKPRLGRPAVPAPVGREVPPRDSVCGHDQRQVAPKRARDPARRGEFPHRRAVQPHAARRVQRLVVQRQPLAPVRAGQRPGQIGQRARRPRHCAIDHADFPRPFPACTVVAAGLKWRRVPESNRSSRICNPLRNLSANPPP